jgi:predicted peptidase
MAPARRATTSIACAVRDCLGVLKRGAVCRSSFVAPQSFRGGWDAEALDALLDEVLKQYRVDAHGVYLTGESMGGYGTWALAAAHSERFAAIAPICGGGEPAWAAQLKGVPTWAFHGADDKVVPPEESRKMVAAIQHAGGDARLTIYPGIGHDSWTETFQHQEAFMAGS